MLKKIKSIRTSLSPQVRSSIALFFASLIASGISYLTTPIYTRLLTANEYGKISLYMTWQNIFGIIAMFSLSAGVFNNGMIEYPEDRDNYSSSMLLLSNLITILIFLVLLLLYPFIDGFIGLDQKYIIIMFVCFLSLPAYNFWVQKQRFEYKYKGVFLTAIIVALISPMFGILGILIFDDNVWGRVLFSELSLALLYCLFYCIIIKRGKIKPNLKYWGFAFRFNLPLIPHYLSMYLLSNVDRIMINNMVGASQTAYYSVANTVASVVLIIWSAINASFIPYTYEKLKCKRFSDIASVTDSLVFVFCAVCTLFILIAPELVVLISTKEYLEAIYVIPPVAAGVFFQVQYSLYANAIYYYKKPQYVMFGSIFSVILNIVLNYLSIPIFGYIAAGYTTLICYMVQSLIDLFALRAITKERIYNLKVIIYLSFGMIIVSTIGILLYEYRIIRYCVFVLCVVGFFMLYKKIKSVYEAIKK